MAALLSLAENAKHLADGTYLRVEDFLFLVRAQVEASAGAPTGSLPHTRCSHPFTVEARAACPDRVSASPLVGGPKSSRPLLGCGLAREESPLLGLNRLPWPYQCYCPKAHGECRPLPRKDLLWTVAVSGSCI